jgi:parvulin-like peptidyl-prolyl isomerase
MKIDSFAFIRTIVILGMVSGAPAAYAEEAADEAVFAFVGDAEITREEFEREVYAAARQTFYHGQPPGKAEYIEFRRGVADRLIDRHLLLREAERRAIEPDTESIEARIAQYEVRYGDTERWQTEGPAMVASLSERFRQDSLLESLEREVRRVGEADDTVVKAFYEQNPDLFTQPASNRVSVILLGVAPSAGAPGWQAAREEAGRIVERLEDGDDFAELAALLSSDTSAAAGGDMGYQHEGALSPEVETAIAELDVGEVSAPIRVLEGMVIFKLLDRRPRQLQAFEDVEERAAQLWGRQAGEAQWQQLLAELRADADADIRVDADYLLYTPGYVD